MPVLRHIAHALLILCLACAQEGIAGTSRHPQDGPHADVQIEISEQSVLFDVLLNLVLLDELGDFPRENPSEIHFLEEGPIRESLLTYFRENHRVAVDGIEVAPVIRLFEVVRSEPSNVVLFPRTQMRGLNKIHVLLDYPIKGEFKSVAMKWGAYPPDPMFEPDEQGNRPPIRLEARLLAEGRMNVVTFTHDEPEYTYHATGLSVEDRFDEVPALRSPADTTRAVTIPGVSIALLAIHTVAFALFAFSATGRAGLKFVACALIVTAPGAYLLRGAWRIPVGSVTEAAPQMTSEDALEVFRPLHANIYRAFDYRSESAIYDALARSVSGDMLDALYNQIYRSLIMMEEGGAVSSVQAVRLAETTVEEVGELASGERGFTVLARWQVDGVVNHFGHSHWRTNQYLARFGVAEGAEGWRIASHEPIEQERLDTDPFVNPLAPEAPDEQAGPNGAGSSPLGEL